MCDVLACISQSVLSIPSMWTQKLIFGAKEAFRPPVRRCSVLFAFPISTSEGVICCSRDAWEHGTRTREPHATRRKARIRTPNPMSMTSLADLAKAHHAENLLLALPSRPANATAA